MVEIKPFTSDYDDYRKDESRSVGYADSISFPICEDDVRSVLAQIDGPVTVQGGRTGLAAGAVPHGGHVLNLTKMNRCLGMRRDDTAFCLRVQPGVVLSQLRKDLEDKRVDTAGWDAESLAAWEKFSQAGPYFFPTDPTETSATIGGMVACNASGARSYRYGPIRPHVSALRVALADGDMVCLRRGEVFAQGRRLRLATEDGRVIDLDLPTYTMPAVKNASGYWAADDMDAVDLFVGSDGTLGVITEIELRLMPTPAVTWGVSCFFTEESQALAFTGRVRDRIPRATAIEFFDEGALNILRRQKERSTAFSSLLPVEGWVRCCIYVELACDAEGGDDGAYENLYRLGTILKGVGGSEDHTWVGRTDIDREQQRFFRHAVPESANMLIDERRKADPTITKLGSDMSVPDDRLFEVVEMYRRTLRENGLETAVWGHVGDNHLHVNVLPRDHDDFARGKALYRQWARWVTDAGGAVSAEHGVGKLKRDFLAVMYGPDHIREMARLKRQLDPRGVLGRGNLFGEDVLDEVTPAGAGEAGRATDTTGANADADAALDQQKEA